MHPHGHATLTSTPIYFYLLVAVAAIHRILIVAAANHWQLVHPERVAMVGVFFASGACLALWILTRIGMRRAPALLTTLVVTVAVVSGGVVARDVFRPFGGLVLIAVVVLSALLSLRLSESLVLGASVVFVVVLASGAIFSGFSALAAMGEDQAVGSERAEVSLAKRPDIYLVFFDAYTGRRALGSIFDESKDGLVAQLENRSFQLPQSAWTAYPTTEIAIPTVLDMSHPIDSMGINGSTRQRLHGMISGDNSTVAIVADSGYHTTMIESGWVGSSCGPAIDECIPSDWLDEVMGYVLADTVVWQAVVNQSGHAFTANALHTMEMLRELSGRSRGQTPQFVLAHVLAPHPPFFLNESCELTVDHARVIHSYSQTIADDMWDHYYVQQSQCVDEFVLDVVDSFPEDDVVIMLGDHGIGRRPPPEGGEPPVAEGILEHQNVFLAARLGDGCELTDPIITSDLMRQVFSCLADEPLEPVEPRMYLRGGYEMSPEEINELIHRS